MANESEILQLYAYLLDAYPSYEPKSEHPERPWLHHFAQVDPETLRAAIDLHIERSHYFPTIADLRALFDGAPTVALLRQSEHTAAIVQSIAADRTSILRLEQAAYAGRFDQHEWDLLISDLAAHDHPHQAAALSRRLKTITDLQIFNSEN